MALSVAAQRRIVLLLAAACLACASAPREGESVHIAEESAIIVWDAASKTQHFIRRASFDTKAKDFGFLVPTPTVPELAEADDAAFRLLESLTYRMPRVAAVAKSEPAKAAAVAVIQQVKVAGFDAAVLAANDANALDDWLKKNGYASTPALVDWYKPYLDKGWIITAFKVAQDAGAARLETSAVRMSFKAEQPFFPYREPKPAVASGARLLKVFYLGESRAEAKFGAMSSPLETVWSGEPKAEELDSLWTLLKLPGARPAGIQRLTEFQDASAKRESDEDLVFAAAADQSTMPDAKRQELAQEIQRKSQRSHAVTIVALILAIVAGVIGLLFYRRVRKS